MKLSKSHRIKLLCLVLCLLVLYVGMRSSNAFQQAYGFLGDCYANAAYHIRPMFRSHGKGPVVPEGSHTVIWVTRDLATRDEAGCQFVPLKIENEASIERIRGAINGDYRWGGPQDYQTAGMTGGQMIVFCFDDGQSFACTIYDNFRHLVDSEFRFYKATRTPVVMEDLRAEGKTSVIEWDEAIELAPETRYGKRENEMLEDLRKRIKENRQDSWEDEVMFIPAPEIDEIP